MEKSYEIEKKLLVLLSRVTFSSSDVEEINTLLKENISWCELFKYAMHNKVVSLIWTNLNYFNAKHIPKYIKNLMNCIYTGTKIQNGLYICLLYTSRCV